MASPELVVEKYDGAGQDQRVLLVRGPLTFETSRHFDQVVRGEKAETMIIDMSNVPYIDSVGLGSLVSANVSHQKAGRCMVLTGVSPRVTKVLEITQVKQFFMTFPTTWEAVEALSNMGSA
jgi:anti-sigma B factor antagonist